MDQSKKELTLQESIKQVMQTLPPPIRRYLASGKYSTVAQNLMRKYSLHVDQGGILERELMLLLMGIENPEEFAESLKSEAAIPEDMLLRIMADINQEVFVPLRKEEMKPVVPTAPATAAPRTVPQVGAPAAPRPAEVRQPIGGGGGSRYFHLENKLPSTGSAQPPLQQRQPLPHSSGVRPPTSGVASLPPKTIMPRPTGAISGGGTQLLRESQAPFNPQRRLEDHEEPSPSLKATEGTAHIEFNKPSTLRPSAPLRPAEAFGIGGPPANLPGAMPPQTVPPPPPVAPNIESPVPPKPKPIVPAAPYATDPYREPIDEQ